MKHCPYCDAKIRFNDIRCFHCGGEFGSGACAGCGDPAGESPCPACGLGNSLEAAMILTAAIIGGL